MLHQCLATIWLLAVAAVGAHAAITLDLNGDASGLQHATTFVENSLSVRIVDPNLKLIVDADTILEQVWLKKFPTLFFSYSLCLFLLVMHANLHASLQDAFEGACKDPCKDACIGDYAVVP